MAVVLQSGYTSVIDLEHSGRNADSSPSSTITTSRFVLANAAVGTAPGGGNVHVSSTELTISHSRSSTLPQPPRYGALDLFDPNKRYRVTIEEEEV